jgi:hypothetical protein
MPFDIRRLLDSRPETQGLNVDQVHPEHRIQFDTRRGEPRNADLAFLGSNSKTIAVTVEAKADEPFGATVGDAMTAALQRWLENERSGALARVLDLLHSLVPVADADSHARALRYQLLTAAAGTLAYATSHDAAYGVLIVHEFVTPSTRTQLHAANEVDYRAFLRRLGIAAPNADATLHGPLTVPGAPLFPSPAPLFIGKVTTLVQRQPKTAG